MFVSGCAPPTPRCLVIQGGAQPWRFVPNVRVGSMSVGRVENILHQEVEGGMSWHTPMPNTLGLCVCIPPMCEPTPTEGVGTRNDSLVRTKLSVHQYLACGESGSSIVAANLFEPPRAFLPQLVDGQCDSPLVRATISFERFDFTSVFVWPFGEIVWGSC